MSNIVETQVIQSGWPGPVPRHQTALAMALTALLPGLAYVPLVYDPVFTPVDTAALRMLQLQVRGSPDAAGNNEMLDRKLATFTRRA